jgi:hypothetical protein
MKIKSIYILLAFACSCLYACKSDPLLYEPSGFVSVYMPQAREKPAIRSFFMSEEPQTITYGAVYGGPDYPATDLEIRFKAGDPALLQSFNAEMGTNYPLLPAGSYELETTSTIGKGKSSTVPLNLKVKTAGKIDPAKDYLLPVTIEGVTGDLKINGTLKTSYFLIRAVYQNYDRSAWTVAGFSSENNAAEAVVKAIDGDVNTFWHSQYSPTKIAPPHFIAFNMSETKTLHGFSLSGRRNSDGVRLKKIRIEVSMNGADWTNVGNFELGKVDESTIYLSSAVEAKFFKLWVDEAQGNTVCALAEINAF